MKRPLIRTVVLPSVIMRSIEPDTCPSVVNSSSVKVPDFASAPNELDLLRGGVRRERDDDGSDAGATARGHVAGDSQIAGVVRANSLGKSRYAQAVDVHIAVGPGLAAHAADASSVGICRQTIGVIRVRVTAGDVGRRDADAHPEIELQCPVREAASGAARRARVATGSRLARRARASAPARRRSRGAAAARAAARGGAPGRRACRAAATGAAGARRSDLPPPRSRRRFRRSSQPHCCRRSYRRCFRRSFPRCFRRSFPRCCRRSFRRCFRPCCSRRRHPCRSSGGRRWSCRQQSTPLPARWRAARSSSFRSTPDDGTRNENRLTLYAITDASRESKTPEN